MSPNLRLWPVLHHLTENQVSDIIYVVIYYGNRRPVGCGTALYITSEGMVYAAGVNSYCGKYLKQTEIIKDGGDFLQGSVKVEGLSALKLKKVILGNGFCAGLTAANDLYVWGNALSSIMLLEREYTVMYECYTPDTVCKKCTTSHYSPCSVGGFTINKCEACEWYPSYSLQSSTKPDTPVKNFIDFCDMVVVLCSKCRQWCSFLRVGDYDLYYCEPCDVLQESIGWCGESSEPCKVQMKDTQITDIGCGNGFLLVQTSSNDLILWGFVGYRFQGYVNNPDNVIIQSVTCGGDHLAVITNKGELYTCGVGTLGQLGYDWNDSVGFTTLRKVPLLGSTAVKVCCGLSSTACLLTDGSVSFFGGRICGSGPTPIIMLKQHLFTDISCATLTDFFSASTTSSGVFFWRSPTPKPYLKVDANDCADALVGWPVMYNSKIPKVMFTKQTTTHSCTVHGESHYAEFYGRKLHSDLTLKLKDGDFPAHRMILYSNSVYFKNLLAKSADCYVLDVSSYDPNTYRNLLKYYYQTLILELSWKDLLDLHVLAINYNESDIVKETFKQLQNKLSEENIEEITRLAKPNVLDVLLDDFKNRFKTLAPQ